MANTVEVTFKIDANGEGRAVLRQIDQDLNKIGSTSKQTGGALDSAFAVFKGTLIAQYFQQGLHAAIAFGTGAVSEINKLKAAQIALASVATFKGIGTAAAQDAVNNLALVKSGLLTVGDASKGLQNLLSAGFGLDQAVIIMQRFGDAAAFNRQAALGFGESIVGATEGIKNQNSMLVDNVGITKNLDKILGDYGFNLQDLSDKTKGQAARQALLNGLVAESAPQVGNAAKLTGTFAGAMTAAEAAQTRFMQAVGESIITNKAFNDGLASVVTFIGQLTAQLNDPKSDLSKMLSTAVTEAGELVKLATKIGTALSEWHVPAAVSAALKVGLAVVNPGAIIDFGREDIEAAGEKTKTAFQKLHAAYVDHVADLAKTAAAEKTLADLITSRARDSEAAHTQLMAGGSFSLAKKVESPLADQIAMLAKLNADVHADNPFVTLYAQGRLAQNELEKASRGFTTDLRKRLLEVQQDAFNLKKFGLEASNAVQVAGLRASALALKGDRSFEGRAADRAVANVGMLAESNALRSGIDSDPIAVIADQIKAVQLAMLPYAEAAQKIEQLTSGLNADQLWSSGLGEKRANALDAIRRNPFVDPAVEAAKAQLTALNALKGTGSAGEQAIQRSQFLSITGGLRADQLDPELRSQVVQQKMDEAKSLEQQRQEQIKETQNLNQLIEKLLTKLDTQSLVKVTLQDDSKGALTAEMGEAPTPESSGAVSKPQFGTSQALTPWY